jgi:hypothetical protein
MELPMAKSTRFKCGQDVVEIFAARTAGCSVLETTPDENVDSARRDEWRASLDDEQTLSVAMIASGMTRLGAIPNWATFNQALLNVVKGADPDDPEDVAMRNSLAIALRERTYGKPTASMLVGGTKWPAKFHEKSLGHGLAMAPVSSLPVAASAFPRASNDTKLAALSVRSLRENVSFVPWVSPKI